MSPLSKTFLALHTSGHSLGGVSYLRWNNWYGNFLFDKDAEFKGVIVHVNNSFKLWFDQNGQWIGFFVYNSKSGFNLFDKDDTWLGYILPNGAGNWNLFDTEGEWAGFTT